MLLCASREGGWLMKESFCLPHPHPHPHPHKAALPRRQTCRLSRRRAYADLTDSAGSCRTVAHPMYVRLFTMGDPMFSPATSTVIWGATLRRY